MRKVILILFLVYVGSTHSQELVTTFKNSLKTSSSELKSFLPVVNQTKNEIALILSDSKNIYAYSFSDAFEPKESFSIKNKKKKFTSFLGRTMTNDGTYHLFLANEKKDKFVRSSISFNSKSIEYKEFTLLRDYESFLKAFEYKNQFYMLSFSVVVNTLYLYTFDDSGNPKRHIIDTKEFQFYNRFGNEAKLADIIIHSYPLKRFDQNRPYSVEYAGDKRKMYLEDNMFRIGFDFHDELTQILSIDLNSLTADVKNFEKPLKDIKRKKKTTNSFLKDGYLYSLCSSKEKLVFQIKEFETGRMIKESSFSKGDSINLSSTDFFKERGRWKRRKNFVSSDFFSTFKESQISISVYNCKDKKVVSFGLFYPIVNMFNRPSENSYKEYTERIHKYVKDEEYLLSYLSSKSIWFESLLDANFNPSKVDSYQNLLEKIKYFENPKNDVNIGYTRSSKRLKSEPWYSLFLDDKLYLFDVNEEEKTYFIVKFSN